MVIDIGNPGFTEEPFKALKVRRAQYSSQIFCTLIIDEMAIRKQIWWQKSHWIINSGTGYDSDDKSFAKNALVFLLVAVNQNWKIPVGYFLTDGVTAEQISNLVLNCIRIAGESGIRVISLTFDGTHVIKDFP